MTGFWLKSLWLADDKSSSAFVLTWLHLSNRKPWCLSPPLWTPVLLDQSSSLCLHSTTDTSLKVPSPNTVALVVQTSKYEGGTGSTTHVIGTPSWKVEREKAREERAEIKGHGHDGCLRELPKTSGNQGSRPCGAKGKGWRAHDHLSMCAALF